MVVHMSVESVARSPYRKETCLPDYGPKQLSRNAMKEDTKECSGGLSAKGGAERGGPKAGGCVS